MAEQFSRIELLFGEEAVRSLADKTVAVFGIGGVGGYTVEALSRSGVGHLVLIDKDVVSESNINRQIIALHSTVGRPKTEVMKERILDINPNAEVETHEVFYLPDTRDEFNFENYDYVVDAVDTVTAKIDIVVRCKELGIPIISAMGAGNKLDPTKFEVADISKTEMDPLCKVMRRELRNRDIKHLKVVYSREQPVVPKELRDEGGKRNVPGSAAFVPSVMGLIIAGEVIKDLLS